MFLFLDFDQVFQGQSHIRPRVMSYLLELKFCPVVRVNGQEEEPLIDHRGNDANIISVFVKSPPGAQVGAKYKLTRGEDSGKTFIRKKGRTIEATAKALQDLVAKAEAMAKQ